MNLDRHHLARLLALGAAAATLCGLCSRPAWAQAAAWPAKPITMLLAAPPGGATDAIGRTLAEEMGKTLGQNLIVDYRPGASGMLGTQAVARSPADGYTLLMSTTTPVYYTPYLFSKMAYDPKRDLAFVTQVTDATLVVVAGKNLPVKNLSELVAHAGKHKGQVSYGSWGVGSSAHLLSSYLGESRHAPMNHVPYKGEAQILQDLIGGQLGWSFTSLGSTLPHIKSGSVRPLALLGAQRSPELPDVPTFAEQGFTDKEFKLVGGLVLMAPAGVSKPVMDKLEKAARDAIRTPQMRARFQVYGLPGVGNSSEEARLAFEASGPVIEKLVKISGARLD